MSGVYEVRNTAVYGGVVHSIPKFSLKPYCGHPLRLFFLMTNPYKTQMSPLLPNHVLLALRILLVRHHSKSSCHLCSISHRFPAANIQYLDIGKHRLLPVFYLKCVDHSLQTSSLVFPLFLHLYSFFLCLLVLICFNIP